MAVVLIEQRNMGKGRQRQASRLTGNSHRMERPKERGMREGAKGEFSNKLERYAKYRKSKHYGNNNVLNNIRYHSTMTDQEQQRKNDTRRKIIAGALALEHAQNDPDFAATLAGLLNEYVIKPADRALFDFLPERVN